MSFESFVEPTETESSLFEGYPSYVTADSEISVCKKDIAAEIKDFRETYKEWNLNDDQIEALAHYFRDFFLSQDDIEGKKILDVGSGWGGFSDAVEKMNLESKVTKFDDGKFIPRSMDVRGDANKMPFASDSFDLTLAHCSVPIMQATRGNRLEIPSTIKEMVRVTKMGGKIKIYPAFIIIDEHIEAGFEEKYKNLNMGVLEQINALHKEFPEYSFRVSEIEFVAEDHSVFSRNATLEIVKNSKESFPA